VKNSPVKTGLFLTDIIISFYREIENPVSGSFRKSEENSG
jgi:hypothetical protein